MLSDYIRILKKNVLKVMDEDGCIDYCPLIDIETDITVQNYKKNEITIVERWKDEASLNNHLNTSHMSDYREKVKDMVLDVEIRVLKEV